jgi:redox-sensitive transcriptional activator SoxR
MTLATDSLPNDLQALKALVSAQRAEIERLNMMIAKLRRMQFGRSSEQLDAMIDQLQLSLEELQVIQTELTPPTEPPPRVVSRRKPLPEHLPREIHVHPPESQCSGCGGKLRQLGEDVSEVLEYVPARFKVIRHSVLRRVAFIVFAQRIGLSLDEVEAELAHLPIDRVPMDLDWKRLTSKWKKRIEQNIAQLQALNIGLDECIGCGCLSMSKCLLTNPGDRSGRNDPGPRRWLGDSPPETTET